MPASMPCRHVFLLIKAVPVNNFKILQGLYPILLESIWRTKIYFKYLFDFLHTCGLPQRWTSFFSFPQDLCSLTKGEQELLLGQKRNSHSQQPHLRPSLSARSLPSSPSPGEEPAPSASSEYSCLRPGAPACGVCIFCGRRAAASELRLAAGMQIRERIRALSGPGPPPSSPAVTPVTPHIGRGRALVHCDGQRMRFDIFLPSIETAQVESCDPASDQEDSTKPSKALQVKEDNGSLMKEQPLMKEQSLTKDQPLTKEPLLTREIPLIPRTPERNVDMNKKLSLKIWRCEPAFPFFFLYLSLPRSLFCSFI